MSKKEQKNAVAEQYNWQQRCNKELEGSVKWEENWGHIFNPDTMQEGKHRSIDVRIAELKEELDRVKAVAKTGGLKLTSSSVIGSGKTNEIARSKFGVTKNKELMTATYS